MFILIKLHLDLNATDPSHYNQSEEEEEQDFQMKLIDHVLVLGVTQAAQRVQPHLSRFSVATIISLDVQTFYTLHFGHFNILLCRTARQPHQRYFFVVDVDNKTCESRGLHC